MYAAVHLPTFHLQAALRWREGLWAEPIVVLDTETGSVLERTLAASAREILPGMSAAQAQARCPGLKVINRAAAPEEALSWLVQEVALTHSPLVEANAPDAVVLDWRGMFHQLDWHAMGDQLVRDLREAGVRAVVAVARTPDVALLAAREADPVSVIRDTGEYLHPLPVSFLQPDERVRAILQDWGIATIGEFLRLPKAQTIERLGSAAQEMWRIASGRTHRPLRLIAPPEIYAECCDFEYTVETTEPLLFLLRRFVDQLSARLRARYLVASQMTLRLPLDDKSEYERVFSIPEPTSQADVFFRILETHLEQLTLPQQPVALHLVIEPARPTRQQFGLFGATLRDPNRFGHTLARLGALVGGRGVGFPMAEDTHKPDSYQLASRVPWSIEEAAAVPDQEWLGLPLQRLRPAVAARVETVDGCPSKIASAVANGRIVEVLGPYRLSGHWWEQGEWRTEEWDISMNDGALYRIAYREEQWWVEGCYERVC